MLSRSPKWMNKAVATLAVGSFELQGIGDFVSRCFATFTNDTSVQSFFLVSARVAARLEQCLPLRKAEVSLNVTNLTDKQRRSTTSVDSATNSFSADPIAPPQWFVTLSAEFCRVSEFGMAGIVGLGGGSGGRRVR